jgi:hypothetical protein
LEAIGRYIDGEVGRLFQGTIAKSPNLLLHRHGDWRNALHAGTQWPPIRVFCDLRPKNRPAFTTSPARTCIHRNAEGIGEKPCPKTVSNGIDAPNPIIAWRLLPSRAASLSPGTPYITAILILNQTPFGFPGWPLSYRLYPGPTTRINSRFIAVLFFPPCNATHFTTTTITLLKKHVLLQFGHG